MSLTIPNLSLVALIGPSGSGKSTFARRHFLPTEVLSSDFCRGLVRDDENAQEATNDAFDVLHFIASRRLAAGRLTVIDATSVRPEDRKPLVRLAREYHCLPVAIVFNLPERVCQERNEARPDRDFGPHVIRHQRATLRRHLRGLKREGFRHIHIFESSEEVDAATIERVPLWNDKRDETGPFDIIGDVHGCFEELAELLTELGYAPSGDAGAWSHPAGRKMIFLGDLVDRGPKVPEVLRLVMDSVNAGTALCVPGNHDIKLMRAIWGKKVQIRHGLAESLEQLEAYEQYYRGFSRVAAEFIDGLVSHYVLDGGDLVVAHAGMKEDMQGRGSGKVREFALYGETTGETDEFGLPIRHNWAAEYRGQAHVVYGHTPVPEAEWLNRTVNIDTGCVFGGKLTAMRWPEREFVSVPAKHTYAESRKPFLDADARAPSLTAQHAHDDVLDMDDVRGKRIIVTQLRGNVIIREDQSTAALEVMSRFAANPKWLIYLPPTMSPCETHSEGDLLEHPDEAFAYYRGAGVPKVVCEEKHMGSRAVVVICRDEETARRRFGVDTAESGIVYTRTGRRFFQDAVLESALLERLRSAMTAADVWETFETDWACLDCELMPWSAKAQELLREQYAAVGAAGGAALPASLEALQRTSTRLGESAEAAGLIDRIGSREQALQRYVDAYRRYCWPVNALDDLKLAPFHLLATEGRIHTHQNHVWHMDTLASICAQDEALLLATPSRVIDVTDMASCAEGAAWWTELTERGGEGMVVKPFEFHVRSRRGLEQPAVKCRGREYLRIIYGPEYDSPDHIARMRKRGLKTKRSLALREFALGIEALQRFVQREPLRRVHECVFGVLALESEPVDPRL